MPSPLTNAIDKFPRVRLGHVPTPLDAAPRLGAALGIELWIKRDDCTGLAMGGNKVRQLEFPLGEAQYRDADTLLITSAVQSNYVRVAAAAGRRLGMETHIQLEERVPDVDALYRSSGNVLLDRLFGATLHSFPVGEDEPAADASLDLLAQSLAEEGRRPYVIHLAPAHPPLGALGYVLAAEETLAQARSIDLEFDAVVCPTGSALTHAGLLVGFRALGKKVPVFGICVRRDTGSQVVRVSKVAEQLASMIDRPEVFDADDITAFDGVLAPGYGRINDAVREAIALAARQEGLLLDPVYTGKTMAGLIDHVRSGIIPAGSRVLFVHTGGLPAIFAYGDRLGSWLSDVPWGEG
ncbi:MAG: D-cysteine desulfhydrase family protein [Gemmatimonadetes bacterium]|nr:D-cysteine desulfhydrase family protein [Gemmatimonadota bacterium]MYH20387.1 D-cysteine desulfhydrase family protein [Gemmatimonadota bacterium]MYK99210.1 D-cysteine desulfhydrase family protein [Gemmatimonadota bacterium]